MKEIIVTDSTCLIVLERIERLNLLSALFDSIFIPPAVQQEFGIHLPWLQVEIPTDEGMILTLKMLVDDGEAEAIALAYQKKLPIILDDRQARTVAKNLKIPFIGTIKLLIKAKQRGMISALEPLLDELEQNGFYLTEALKKEALKFVNEEF